MDYWTGATSSFKNWDIRNNIFYVSGSSGYCILYGTATTAELPALIDYNVYYVPSGADYGYTSTGYTTFAGWQAANHDVPAGTKGDENSISGNPYYTNAASYNLDLGNALSKALHRGTAAIVATYPTDIYGTARVGGSSTPCSGANEAYIALPISLINFTVDCDPNTGQASLHWTTASETNNDFFTIERSYDVASPEIIGTVDGAGNSNEFRDYEMTDNRASEQHHVYYRLIQTDYDGTKKSFPWIFLNCENNKDEQLVLFPNPVETNLYYEITSFSEQMISVRITDLIGKTLMTQSSFMNKGRFVNEIDISSLSSGVYFFNLQQGKNTITKKIVKQ